MYIKHSKKIINEINKSVEDNYVKANQLSALINAINTVGVELHQKTSKELLDIMKKVLTASNLEYDEEKVSIILGLAGYLGISPYDIKELSGFVLFMYKQTTGYDIKAIEENEYFKNIKIPCKAKGNFKLSYGKHQRGDLFSDKEPNEDGYLYLPFCGYYKNDFSYPLISENGNVWMSITQNEINTMEEHINFATGKVLTLGLGLGYYQYMTHLKEDVKEITIIEKEQAVIDLFKENILPQFKYPEKIKIINADAFDYLKDLKGNEYDYCFCDIWQNCVEGVDPYLKLKKLENKFPEIKFSYWIENSLLMQIKLIIPLILVEEIDKIQSTNPFIKITKKSISYTKEIEKLLENEQIIYPDSVKKLFTYDYLKQILKNYK